MSLGVDKNNYLVYEGHVHWGGRAVFPGPHLFGLRVAGTPEQALDLLKHSTDHDRLLFREDGFDPVSMVRRGRVYVPNRSYPTECRVCPVDEAEREEARKNGGVVSKPLICFEPFPLSSQMASKQLFAAIGTDAAYSIWRIVSNDRTYLDEELVTMRPLYFLGALPDLSPDNIPEQWRTKVQETVGKVVDSMYRADADSIVELCRHAATASLCARFHEEIARFDKTDLGPLAKKAEDAELRVIANCAKMLADLHSRIKPNIQIHYNCRPICDRDAEFAIHCLSLILRDLGYTRSP